MTLILTRRRYRCTIALAFVAGCILGALSVPRIDALQPIVVPRPIKGEVLTIAEYLCKPNGGTESMTPHVDPERYSFRCRNEASFSDQRITLQ